MGIKIFVISDFGGSYINKRVIEFGGTALMSPRHDAFIVAACFEEIMVGIQQSDAAKHSDN